MKSLRPTHHSLHWVLDVTMDEDRARNRKDHGPQNLALLRRLALDLGKLDPSKGSTRGTLKRAGWDTTFPSDLLANATRLHIRSPWRTLPIGLKRVGFWLMSGAAS